MIREIMLSTLVVALSAQGVPLSTVEVRHGGPLHQQEADIIAARTAQCRQAIARLVGQDTLLPQEMPNIAFCFSGGGIRALLATLGWLQGAQQTGLYDAVAYTAVLSGSTWAYGSYLSRQLPLQQHLKDIITAVQKGLPSIFDKEVAERIKTQKEEGRGVSLVDIWGVLIGNIVFPASSCSSCFTLSAQRTLLAQGTHPFPLYTAVCDHKGAYRWFEFSPSQVWSRYLNAGIAIEAFGSSYHCGMPKRLIPEQPLEYYLGVCGSAFEAKFSAIVKDVISVEQAPTRSFKDILEEELAQLPLYRLSPAKFKNFTYGLEQSPMADVKKMALVDAGLAFNLPFPPLLEPEREIDIIIACDASQTIYDGGALQGLVDYAQEHDFILPSIDMQQATSQLCSVWINPHAGKGQVKAIIYLPRLANPAYEHNFDIEEESLRGFCATTKFKYKPENAQKLAGLMSFTIQQQHDRIVDAIKQVHAIKRRALIDR